MPVLDSHWVYAHYFSFCSCYGQLRGFEDTLARLRNSWETKKAPDGGDLTDDRASHVTSTYASDATSRSDDGHPGSDDDSTQRYTPDSEVSSRTRRNRKRRARRRKRKAALRRESASSIDSEVSSTDGHGMKPPLFQPLYDRLSPPSPEADKTPSPIHQQVLGLRVPWTVSPPGERVSAARPMGIKAVSPSTMSPPRTSRTPRADTASPTTRHHSGPGLSPFRRVERRLTSRQKQALEALPNEVTITMEGYKFDPAIVTIVAGGKVTWRVPSSSINSRMLECNCLMTEDPFERWFHHITTQLPLTRGTRNKGIPTTLPEIRELDPDGGPKDTEQQFLEFDTSPLHASESFSYEFSRPGVYHLSDAVYSFAHGEIIVLDVTDVLGRDSRGFFVTVPGRASVNAVVRNPKPSPTLFASPSTDDSGSSSDSSAEDWEIRRREQRARSLSLRSDASTVKSLDLSAPPSPVPPIAEQWGNSPQFSQEESKSSTDELTGASDDWGDQASPTGLDGGKEDAYSFQTEPQKQSETQEKKGRRSTMTESEDDDETGCPLHNFIARFQVMKLLGLNPFNGADVSSTEEADRSTKEDVKQLNVPSVSFNAEEAQSFFSSRELLGML